MVDQHRARVNAVRGARTIPATYTSTYSYNALRQQIDTTTDKLDLWLYISLTITIQLTRN